MEPGLQLDSLPFFRLDRRVVDLEMLKMYDWIVVSSWTRLVVGYGHAIHFILSVP